jgi:hypothetical protein
MSEAMPLPAVRSVRDRIDAVVTVEQRRAILGALGCFEPHEHDSVPRVRRAKVPRTAGGAELLAAIDALDHACLQAMPKRSRCPARDWSNIGRGSGEQASNKT